ncbi:MAG: L-histidine N(alpha)-methyltransferase [Alphaproteobacteria bacterium]|nr:L-histidine N(alpha)-methyltransferase [Alphaproteobacteria bacterium]
MYQHHKGTKDGQPMSGVFTWDQHAKHGTIPAYNEEVFQTYLPKAAQHIGKGIPVVEFGPGSMSDAKAVINAVESHEYIPVDCSLEVIKSAHKLSMELPECTVSPAVIDFFSKNNRPLIDRPALGVFLGGTVANIPGPVPNTRPHHELINTFRNLTKAIPAGGYLVVSVDVCEDKDRNIALYNEHWHRLFGVNHIYRMAEELPMNNFDPDGFEYLPVWHEDCSLLAHTVVATKSQNFEMGNDGEILVSVKKGDIFHYNNSFKYRPDFFEDCAEDAGLEVIQSWQGVGTIRLYLFHVPPRDARNSFSAPSPNSYLQELQSRSFYSSSQLALMQEKLRTAA